MLLIAGLGNPGSEYAGHRHNVGFMAVDTIHRRHGFGPWRRRFHAEMAEGSLSGEKVLLLKPLTYMNESGRAVGEAMRFYKLDPADVLVIHDEVDLPPGKMRMKSGGGTAGHNGLRSIGAAIGEDFRRLRIGVGHPGVKEMVPHHVLRDFAKADKAWLAPLLDAIADQAPLLAEGKDTTFANRVHETLGGEEKKVKAKRGKPAEGEAAASKDDAPATSAEPKVGSQQGPLARGLRKLFGV
ncbi:MAG TPA: aminoacyl-tRNA hydrolase [Bauldia sp.]|nr:aminoacyl-tRNA hydrolase [Bauldia sp.]